ncbi:MAG: 2-phosphosulfolactate phosphatase, partial [Bacteroidota bacterium]
VLLCSGWQGKFSWEDNLLAGALAEALSNHAEALPVQSQDDRVTAARSLWQQHRHDLPSAMRLSSHYQRLASAGLEEDIAFCAALNACPVFGRLVGEDLVLGH